MTSEILAKIMGIVAKTGDRVIVLDPRSGAPFALMSLEAYEKLVLPAPANPGKAGESPSLTASFASGMMDPVRSSRASGPEVTSAFGASATSNGKDPDLAVWQEAKRAAVDDWGGDEKGEEEDRYYMEPAE